MKEKITLILAIVSPLLFLGLVNAIRKEGDLERAERQIQREISSLERENSKLRDIAQYFSLKANMEREARQRLNLAKPGETAVMFISPSPLPSPSPSPETAISRFWNWLRRQSQ